MQGEMRGLSIYIKGNFAILSYLKALKILYAVKFFSTQCEELCWRPYRGAVLSEMVIVYERW